MHCSVCITIQVRSNLNLNDLGENEDVEGEDALREGPEKIPPLQKGLHSCGGQSR